MAGSKGTDVGRDIRKVTAPRLFSSGEGVGRTGVVLDFVNLILS